MSMRIRYLIVFAVCFGATFFLPIDFRNIFFRFLFAVFMTGLTWLVQPTEGSKQPKDKRSQT